MAEIATILAYAAALLAVAAMAATTIRQLRYAMFVAGLAALAHFALTDQLGWAIIAAVFLVINGMQISVLRRRARRGAMLEEETSLFQRLLGIEDAGRQQRLRDLMEWRDVDAGAVLMNQHQPDPPLIYVARGAARVECDGKVVGTCGPEEFLARALDRFGPDRLGHGGGDRTHPCGDFRPRCAGALCARRARGRYRADARAQPRSGSQGPAHERGGLASIRRKRRRGAFARLTAIADRPKCAACRGGYRPGMPLWGGVAQVVRAAES